MADMEMHESPPSFIIKSNTFPAKLWNLANDPQNGSVFWSPSGDGVIIDQPLFELELMSSVNQDKTKVFKTTNFNSFIRQLNLYGFRKIDRPWRDRQPLHHFYNPNFKKGQPERLVNLKRLTVTNKAKIRSGEKIKSHALAISRQKSEHIPADEKKGFVQPYQYHNTECHQLSAFDQTPILPRSWMFQYNDVSPFYTNKGIPVSVIRRYPSDPPYGISPSPNTMLLHQEPNYIPHPSHYTPAFFPQVIQCQCQCCTGCYMEADRTGPDPYLYSRYGYFPNYLVSDARNSIQTLDWTPNDASLDGAFQMVDEIQGSPNVHMVRAGTPVKAGLSEYSGSTLYTLSAVSELESFSFQSSWSGSVDPQHFTHVRPEQRAKELAASSASLKKVLGSGSSAEDHRSSQERIIPGQESKTSYCTAAVSGMTGDVPQQMLMTDIGI